MRISDPKALLALKQAISLATRIYASRNWAAVKVSFTDSFLRIASGTEHCVLVAEIPPDWTDEARGYRVVTAYELSKLASYIRVRRSTRKKEEETYIQYTGSTEVEVAPVDEGLLFKVVNYDYAYPARTLILNSVDEDAYAVTDELPAVEEGAVVRVDPQLLLEAVRHIEAVTDKHEDALVLEAAEEAFLVKTVEGNHIQGVVELGPPEAVVERTAPPAYYPISTLRRVLAKIAELKLPVTVKYAPEKPLIIDAEMLKVAIAPVAQTSEENIPEEDIEVTVEKIGEVVVTPEDIEEE